MYWVKSRPENVSRRAGSNKASEEEDPLECWKVTGNMPQNTIQVSFRNVIPRREPHHRPLMFTAGFDGIGVLVDEI